MESEEQFEELLGDQYEAPAYVNKPVDLNSPTLELNLAYKAQISNLESVTDFIVPQPIDDRSMVSVQASWEGLTGSLDGKLELIQSHTYDRFDEIGVEVLLDSVDDSATLERLNFGGKFAGIRYTKNSTEAGELSLVLIAKRK